MFTVFLIVMPCQAFKASNLVVPMLAWHPRWLRKLCGERPLKLWQDSVIDWVVVSHICFMFTPMLGKIPPFWRAYFFRWIETSNQWSWIETKSQSFFKNPSRTCGIFEDVCNLLRWFFSEGQAVLVFFFHGRWWSRNWIFWFVGKWVLSSLESYLISHRIDVWYIYLHVADFDGKCSIRYSIRGRYGLYNSYHIESTWEKIVYKRHIMLVRLGIASLKVYPKQKPLECAPRHSDTCWKS